MAKGTKNKIRPITSMTRIKSTSLWLSSMSTIPPDTLFGQRQYNSAVNTSQLNLIQLANDGNYPALHFDIVGAGVYGLHLTVCRL